MRFDQSEFLKTKNEGKIQKGTMRQLLLGEKGTTRKQREIRSFMFWAKFPKDLKLTENVEMSVFGNYAWGA